MACNWIVGEEIENENYNSDLYGQILWGPPVYRTDERGNRILVGPAPFPCQLKFITNGACVGGEKDATTIIPQYGSLDEHSSLDLKAWWTDDYDPYDRKKRKTGPTFEIADVCPDQEAANNIIDRYSKPKTNKASPMRKQATCKRHLGGPLIFSGFPDCKYTDYIKNGFVVNYHYETISITFDSIVIKNLMQKEKEYLLSQFSEEEIKGRTFNFGAGANLIDTRALQSGGVTLDHEEKIPTRLNIDFLQINKYNNPVGVSNNYRNWAWSWEYTIPNLATLNKMGIVSIEFDIHSQCFLTECPLPPFTPTESYHLEQWYYTDNTNRQINRLI